jgi:hypothetical protein
MQTLRNVAILALIAAAIVAIPGGGTAAGLVGAILSIVFAGAIAYFAGRTYLERRTDVYGLDDRVRAILYAAIAIAVLTITATSRLVATGLGTIAWIALLASCAWALMFVYRAWREY